VIVTVGCANVTTAVVCTVPVLDVYPGADAVIVTDPMLTPVTSG
jgi:hypothetical protein